MMTTRTKLITAGLLAAAALALPACSVSETPGTATVSSADRDAYRAEQAAVTTADAPAANTTVDEYAELRAVVEQAVKETNAYWSANGVSLDVNVEITDDRDSDTCIAPDTETPAWACASVDTVVFDLPSIAADADKGGLVAVYDIVGHEMAHVGMTYLPGFVTAPDQNTDELRATCSSGAFINAAQQVNEWSDSAVDQALTAFRFQQEIDAFNYGFQSADVSRCLTYVEGR